MLLASTPKNCVFTVVAQFPLVPTALSFTPVLQRLGSWTAVPSISVKVVWQVLPVCSHMAFIPQSSSDVHAFVRDTVAAHALEVQYNPGLHCEVEVQYSPEARPKHLFSSQRLRLH